MTTAEKTLPRLKKRYREEIRDSLRSQFGYPNVMVVDSDGKPARVGYRVDEETGKRVRISKRNGKDIQA